MCQRWGCQGYVSFYALRMAGVVYQKWILEEACHVLPFNSSVVFQKIAETVTEAVEKSMKAPDFSTLERLVEEFTQQLNDFQFPSHDAHDIYKEFCPHQSQHQINLIIHTIKKSFLKSAKTLENVSRKMVTPC